MLLTQPPRTERERYGCFLIGRCDRSPGSLVGLYWLYSEKGWLIIMEEGWKTMDTVGAGDGREGNLLLP